MSDYAAGELFEIDPITFTFLARVTVGIHPEFLVFDGTNLWVPNNGDSSISVVSVATAAVVATITSDASNLLSFPTAASFDGERILIVNSSGSLTLFKAADLSLISNVTTGASSQPDGACADEVNFWVSDQNTGSLLRF